MDVFDGTGGGNPLELRGESGPEVVFPSRGDYTRPAARLVSNLDTNDPDDGTAGVPAKV